MGPRETQGTVYILKEKKRIFPAPRRPVRGTFSGYVFFKNVKDKDISPYGATRNAMNDLYF
jgi:hypothetical protein